MSALSRQIPSPGRGLQTPMTRLGALAAGAAAVAVVLAFVLVRQSAAVAFAVVLLPFGAWLITRKTAGLVIGLVLLLALPYWQSLGSTQASVLRVASVAAAATVLFAKTRPRWSATDMALLVFVAASLLGWLLQYDEPHSGRVLSIELTPIGFYLGARVIPSGQLRRVMMIILGAGTIGALTVLYEYAQGSPIFVDPTTYLWNQTGVYIFRPGGIFGSPPSAATVLSFVILFGLGAMRGQTGRIRLFGTSCLIICGLALVATFTRGNMIGVTVGVLVFLWLVRSPFFRPTRLIWFVGLAAVVLLVAIPRLEGNSTFQAGVLRPGTFAARESYWSWALPIATASPHNLLVGVGTTALETPVISSAAPVSSVVAKVPQAYNGTLHSQYVTTLVEQGLVGVAALIALLLTGFTTAARNAYVRRDPIFAAVAASVVAFAICMSVGTDLLNGPSFAMFMVALGFAASGSKTPQDTSTQPVNAT